MSITITEEDSDCRVIRWTLSQGWTWNDMLKAGYDSGHIQQRWTAGCDKPLLVLVDMRESDSIDSGGVAHLHEIMTRLCHPENKILIIGPDLFTRLLIASYQREHPQYAARIRVVMTASHAEGLRENICAEWAQRYPPDATPDTE